MPHAPAADDAQAYDVLSGVEQLSQRLGPQRRGVTALERGQQALVSPDPPHRDVPGDPDGLLAVGVGRRFQVASRGGRVAKN